MKNLYALLFLTGVAVVAVLITSLIKIIIKAIYTKHGKDFTAKAMEYPLAATSFVLAFGSVFLLLYFCVGKYVDYGVIFATFKTSNKLVGDAVLSAVYAGFTPFIYTIVQSPRKFIKWIRSLFK